MYLPHPGAILGVENKCPQAMTTHHVAMLLLGQEQAADAGYSNLRSRPDASCLANLCGNEPAINLIKKSIETL